MRIAILNYADVRNFGDVLFPLVIEKEIRARLPAATIEFITPTGDTWAGMFSRRLDRVQLELFDALILGGGEIVHRFDSMLLHIYRRYGLDSIDRPTDLVYAWTSAPVRYKAWLALGAPDPDDQVRQDIGSAAKNLNFVGARGSRSAANIRSSCGASVEVRQTPDLGWLFPRLLERRSTLSNVDGHPYFTVQTLGFSDLGQSVAALRAISRIYSLRVVLLPLTRCWRDVVPLKAAYDVGEGEFSLIDDWTLDIDKLAILGGATFNIGQSMHGFIGSLSQCRPAGLCVAQRNDRFAELLEDSQLNHFRSTSWDSVETLAHTLVWSPLGAVLELRAKYERELDKIFDAMCEQIMSGPEVRP
ncbi:polysaccharide pyruvyl transferase family protein [Methylocystis sp.]|uniref:polysaccharide pyruvyl transferase family protein n=1 Tax=Methylocystis sp. TaxID=1911079 RepID=UPI003D0FCF5D